MPLLSEIANPKVSWIISILNWLYGILCYLDNQKILFLSKRLLKKSLF
jgi:hypothetical protein